MEYLDVDGTKIRLHREGDEGGRKVVYLHSVSGEVCSLPFFVELAAAGNQILVPELPGFGGSEQADPPWRAVEDAIFHLRRTIDKLSGEPIVLIGSSFGGWLAAELAAWFPDRISALVLISAVGLHVEGAPIFNIFGTPGQVDHEDQLMRRANPHGVDLLSILSAAVADEDVEAGQAIMLHMLRGQTVAARLGWNPYMHDPKLKRRLCAVAAPTLVMWGEDDGIVPEELAREFAGSIPGAKLEILPNAGHLPALERPEPAAQLIKDFLAAL